MSDLVSFLCYLMFILSSSILIFYPDILFLSYLSYGIYLINGSCLSHLSHPSYLSINLIYLTISQTIKGYMHICSWIRSKPPFSKPSIWLGGAMGMSQCEIGTPGGLQSRRHQMSISTRRSEIIRRSWEKWSAGSRSTLRIWWMVL